MNRRSPQGGGKRPHRASGHRSARRGDPRGRAGSGGRRDAQAQDRPPAVHLSDALVRELKATARPGKGEILVKVFSEAAGAFAAEDYVTAIRLGEQAKHIALRAGSARELLGLAYYKAAHWQEAARELTAFRRFSGSTEQNPVIADAYRAMKKPEKALEFVDEVKPDDVPEPVYFEAQIVAAGALGDMGLLDEAIARLEKLDLRPDVAQDHHLRAWYMLGDLSEKRGRFTQARSWFEAVEAADPEATDAPLRARRLRSGA
jgi:tetratricopeptide (TPR) repeat protein